MLHLIKLPLFKCKILEEYYVTSLCLSYKFQHLSSVHRQNFGIIFDEDLHQSSCKIVYFVKCITVQFHKLFHNRT